VWNFLIGIVAANFSLNKSELISHVKALNVSTKFYLHSFKLSLQFCIFNGKQQIDAYTNDRKSIK